MHKLKKDLRSILKKSLSGFEDKAIELLNQIIRSDIPQKDRHKVLKTLTLCLFSSLFGYHNLKQVLTVYGIKSSNFYRLYNKLSYSDITNLSAYLFEHYASEPLIKLGKQSSSTWSRQRITYVIDASIFKTWLKQANSEYFDKFFSGQTGKVEYGYKLTLGGIVIGDTFYPLVFFIASKKFTDSEVAQTILPILHQFTQKLEKQHDLSFGKWFLSIDSGYSHSDLINLAQRLDIEIICVPNKSHLFVIYKGSTNLKNFIVQEFLEQEKEYYEKNPSETSPPFTLRKKAHYKCRGIDVILLFFRLAGSNKVSVIYTTDLNIKEKTLRRHWFQRTHIEQFFRLVKHSLKIAASTYSKVDDFIRKISLFFLKAVFALQIRNACRKRKGMKNITFSTICLHVSKNKIGEDYLLQLLNLKVPSTI
jgi:hypothetical protein